MTYALARARLVTIVEAATPLATALGLPATFRHFPEASDEQPPGARGFYLVAGEDSDAGLLGPYTPDLSGQPRLTTPIRLTIAYPLGDSSGNAQQIDEVIEEDRREISKALLTPANWASDGILWISDDPILMPARRVPVDGGLALVFNFTLVYR